MNKDREAILIVDDSPDDRRLMKHYLSKEYFQISEAENGDEALGVIQKEIPDIILLDVVMPGIDGIEICRQLKEMPVLREIPVVMVTGANGDERFRQAFEAGAVDFVKKPINQTELMVRVRSILTLKHEIDLRKYREKELLEAMQQLRQANHILENLSCLDALTNIANRRSFDDFINKEWRRARREENPLSVIMIDIDYFKHYNDHYGHQAGDSCLQKVAQVLSREIRRSSDLLARYGGEEFVIVSGGTDKAEATSLAEKLRCNIENLQISHAKSSVSKVVTLSLGVATVFPGRDSLSAQLVRDADDALYQAKRDGRNRTVQAQDLKKESL